MFCEWLCVDQIRVGRCAYRSCRRVRSRHGEARVCARRARGSVGVEWLLSYARQRDSESETAVRVDILLRETVSIIQVDECEGRECAQPE